MAYGPPPRCAGTTKSCSPPTTYVLRTDTAVVELWVIAWVAVAFLVLWFRFRKATS